MPIYIGSTEITGGKINLGGSTLTSVYYGEQKIWPSGGNQMMYGNDRIHAILPNNSVIDFAIDTDEFTFECWINRDAFPTEVTVSVWGSTGNANYVMVVGRDVEVRLGSRGFLLRNAFADMLADRPVKISITKSAGLDADFTITTSQGAISYTSSFLDAMRAVLSLNEIYRADRIATGIHGAAWGLLFTNVTTGRVISIPMDTDPGGLNVPYTDTSGGGGFFVLTEVGEWVQQPEKVSG